MVGKIIEFIVGVAFMALVIGLGVTATRWTIDLLRPKQVVTLEQAIDEVPERDELNDRQRNAYEAMFRQEFVYGCTKEGLLERECLCSLEQLERYYGDFLYNGERLERIVYYGYNSQELDIVGKCFEHSPNRQHWDYNDV